MRQEVKSYLKKIIKNEKISEPIYEIGSYQVPGQEGFADLRPLFPKMKFIGCDMRLGPGVDQLENIHYLTLKDNSAGTILLLDTLEHIANPHRAMDEVYRVLKPGGLVVISSVMNYPIHNYPDDYWRFTPKAFQTLLGRFERYSVDFDGDENFPTGVYGHGVKSENKPYNKYLNKVDLEDENNSLTKIANLVGKNKVVLEFGCNSGYMSKVLNENKCTVIGVEIDKEAAKIARQYCKKIIVGDIETIDYDKVLKGYKFDIIIFADILEHLKNPYGILQKTKKFLNKNGKIIISVPNIAHSSIRLELLGGDFEHEKLGILDETHLKYFTKKSILRLIDSCGYCIEQIDTVSLGLAPNTIKKFLLDSDLPVTKKVLRLFNQPDSIAYQFIIIASLDKPKNYSMLGALSKQNKPIDYTNLYIQSLKNELDNILNTRGWKIISFLHLIRKRIPFLKTI